MTDAGKSLGPEHIFKKIIWRSMVGLSAPLAQFTTWTVTGVAALAGLLIGNINSVSQIVSTSGLRWGLILFAFALLFGVAGRQAGMAITNGLEMISKMEGLLNSPEGQSILQSMESHPKQLIEELAAPFYWPLSRIVLAGGMRGLNDYLSADKRLVRMLCIQFCVVWVHGLLAAAGLITIALSIKP